MSLLRIRSEAEGLHLPELGFWLDPHKPRAGSDLVFVSHAHSDHIAAHREAILSAPTARLMRARLPGAWRERVLAWRQPTRIDHAGRAFDLTLLPAGHIFGSAMALIEAGAQSLLYTGDFKLRPSLSAESCEPRRVDILVMETTFGLPRYIFPPAGAVLDEIAGFCRATLDEGKTAVLLGYSLGKSQELLCGLANAGLPLVLHEAIAKLTRIYEELGRTFPKYELYLAGQARGKVLLCPPNALTASLGRELGPTRTAIVSGWAIDSSCRFRYRCDAAFPLSDHADFPELLAMAKHVQPKKIYTTHGFAAEFAETLRDLGFDAQALGRDEQLNFTLGVRPGYPPHGRARRSRVAGRRG